MPIQMFDDGQDKFVESVQNFGEAVGGLLKQRLHKKQYEDFLAGPTKELQASLQQANDILLDESNPEGPSQGMAMLKSSLETYMDEGARYSDNPIIQQRVQQTFRTNMDFLKQEFAMKFDAAKNERAQAKAKREQETHDATIEKTKAETAKLKAESGKIGKEAAGADDMPELFSGKPGSIDPMQEDPDRAKELWNRIEIAVDRPGSEAQRKAVEFGMGDIRNRMAQQKLAEMAGRGEIKPTSKDAAGMPTGGGQWDVFNPEDLAAVAGTIDATEVRNRYIMERAKTEGGFHGIKPDAIDKEFGVVVDPTKANAFRPLKNSVSSENLGKVLFGVGGWDALRDSKTRARPRNLDEAAARLPASIEEAHGPIAETFKRYAKGQLPEGIDPKSIKKPEELDALLYKAGYSLITAVIGDNAPANALDEGMKQNRLEAKKLVESMVEKYRDEIYQRVTGKVKKTEGKTEAEAAKDWPVLGVLARRVGQVTTGVLKPATKAYKEFTED